jgi:hypothetical protein
MTAEPVLDVPALANAVAALTHAEARRLLIEVMGRRSRRAGGLRVVLAIDALLACARDGGDVSTRVGYRRWRQQQPHPAELPSARFVAGTFEHRWSAALQVAGLPVPIGRQMQQRNIQTGGYSPPEMTSALNTWLVETTGADLTFRAYEAWARARLAAHPGERLPVSAPTFRLAFGSWQRAVDLAIGGATPPRRGRGVHNDYGDQRMLARLSAAATATGLGTALTRSAYDRWSRARPVETRGRPPHSETFRRRFGSWSAALAAAGLRPI